MLVRPFNIFYFSACVLLYTHLLYQCVVREIKKYVNQNKIAAKTPKPPVLRRLKSRARGARAYRNEKTRIILYDLTAIRTPTGTLGLTSTQSFQLLVLQGLASTQSFQPLVLQGLASTQSFQLLVPQVLVSPQSFQPLILQALASTLVLQVLASTQSSQAFGTPGTREYSVISAFDTPGTREYSVISAVSTPGTRECSVISAFGTPCTREYSVISAFGTPGTETFKMTDTRKSLSTNDWP